jgi:diguanylate cyclase
MVAESIRQMLIETAFSVGGNNKIHITASIGFAAYDGHPDYKRMISRADAAVYEAKATGRNQCMLAK